jgi:hypothetical protein
MEFLLLFTAPPGAPDPEPAGMEEMGKYARELVDRGVLKRGAPLAPGREGSSVRVRNAKPYVTDGPFAESKEVVGGFWIVDVADRDAALEIARCSPHARHASVQVHAIGGRHTFRDSESGKPFLLVFRMEPGFRADPQKGAEMRAFGTPLVEAAILFETAHLADEPSPKRVVVRSGKALVTDGPFAESKEAIGGYGLVRVADREEAVELAGRFPHARWGPVEVREVLFFDRVAAEVRRSAEAKR